MPPGYMDCSHGTGADCNRTLELRDDRHAKHPLRTGRMDTMNLVTKPFIVSQGRKPSAILVVGYDRCCCGFVLTLLTDHRLACCVVHLATDRIVGVAFACS